MIDLERTKDQEALSETSIDILSNQIENALEAYKAAYPPLRPQDEEDEKIIWSDKSKSQAFQLHSWYVWNGSGWGQTVSILDGDSVREIFITGSQHVLPNSSYAYQKEVVVQERIPSTGESTRRDATPLDLEEAGMVCEIITTDLQQVARKNMTKRELGHKAQTLDLLYNGLKQLEISEIDYFKS